MLKTNCLVTAIVLALVSTGSAADLSFLDFAGWDHNQIANGGQTFVDICGSMDATVRSVGAFDADSTFIDTQTGLAVRSEHSDPGSHSFVFTFSEPIEIALDFTRLDSMERLGVYGIGTETYVHSDGIAPTISVDGSGISLIGNGVGLNAANGTVNTGLTSVLTVSYEALPNATATKYQDFTLFKVVPEPGSISLLGLAVLGLLRFRKRG